MGKRNVNNLLLKWTISLKIFWVAIRKTFIQWKSHDPFNKSIILSYYTIFSLPGLLIIIINLLGSIYEKKEVITKISSQMESVMGGNTAADIRSIIFNASETKGTILESIIGIVTLLFGATGVFYHLQQILNKIAGVKPKIKTKQRFLELIRDRLFSFGLILVVGFLMLVSLVVSTGLNVVSDWVAKHFSQSLNLLFGLLDILVSITVITFLFAAIFKFLPDAKLKWRDVWIGAALTSILFVVAKFALGLYFGTSNPASTYGAAGSIILIMLWVSYSGLILLFGAEFIHVYGKMYRRKVVPTVIAEIDKSGE